MENKSIQKNKIEQGCPWIVLWALIFLRNVIPDIVLRKLLPLLIRFKLSWKCDVNEFAFKLLPVC